MPPLPPPPPCTVESLQRASPGAKEEGASKASNSSGACKNASGRKRQKRKREDSANEQTRRCSAVALAYWNKIQKSEGLPEYVLVELVTSVAFIKSESFCFHANFKARPKNDHSVEAELFFVEVEGNVFKKKRYQINKVCALGPSDSVNSGLNGCKACVVHDEEDLPIHHPEGGFCVGYWVHTID